LRISNKPKRTLIQFEQSSLNLITIKILKKEQLDNISTVQCTISKLYIYPSQEKDYQALMIKIWEPHDYMGKMINMF
jgi:hypothetical protein